MEVRPTVLDFLHADRPRYKYVNMAKLIGAFYNVSLRRSQRSEYHVDQMGGDLCLKISEELVLSAHGCKVRGRWRTL
jgi:hypothetical protein